MTTKEPQGQVCYPCSHFDQGALDDSDALSRRIIRYPVSSEVVGHAARQMCWEAVEKAWLPRLIVHVEKGRTMARLTVTAA